MSKLPKLPKSYLDAIEIIKSKGFTHIKLELEAQLNRGDADSGCGNCNDGTISCFICEATGMVETDNTINLTMWNNSIREVPEQVECDNCGGEGYTTCGACNGRSRSRDSYDVEWCQEYMTSHVSAETLKAIEYSEFYDDGSVDSEFTVTLPSDKAYLFIDIMNVFNALSFEISGTIPNVDNAGMHISILPSGSYPCPRGLLNNKFMENFRTETTKLLPALYFLSTHNATTRSLEYRMPHVSAHDKYSAIFTHGDTCMEFRVFDTCYDTPTALYEKIETIAATLRYYSTEKVAVKYKKFTFPHLAMSGHAYVSLRDYFSDLSTYNTLNETVKYLKPKAKSSKKLKSDRDVIHSRKSLIDTQRIRIESAKTEYNQYCTDTRRSNLQIISRYYSQQLNRFLEYGSEEVSYSLLGRLESAGFPTGTTTIREFLMHEQIAKQWLEENLDLVGAYRLLDIRSFIRSRLEPEGCFELVLAS